MMSDDRRREASGTRARPTRPRRIRSRSSARTIGSSRSAISAAIRNRKTREPPRSRRPTRSTSSSGSPTSWIQRGIWIRGGGPAGALTRPIVQRRDPAAPAARLGLVARRGRRPGARPSRALGRAAGRSRLHLADGHPVEAPRAVRLRCLRCRRPRPQGGRLRSRRHRARTRRRRRLAVVAVVLASSRSRCSSSPPSAAATTPAARSRRPPSAVAAAPGRAADARGGRAPRRRSRSSCRSTRAASRRSATTAARDGALALDADRHAGEPGPAASGVAHAIFGGGSGVAALVPAPRRGRPATRRRSTSAPPPGTDVYSPVDGTIVGIEKVILDGKVLRRSGSTSSRPRAPSLVVSVSHVAADPSLTVGAAGHGRQLEARRAARPLEGRDSRRSRATRTTRATTCCRGPPRRDALPSADDRRAQDPLRRRRVRRARAARGRVAGCRRCARSSASTSASSTARTPPTAAGSRRRSPSGCSPSGADVITLGNWVWGQQGFAPYLLGHRPRAAAGEPVAATRRAAGSPCTTASR